MRIVSVVGARPQFIKLAPIDSVTTKLGVEHVIVHTGQHYDDNMSSSFFEELGIKNPDIHLGIGSGSHGTQTGRMLEALDSVFVEIDPDWVLVYGDTNSTIAATLSAVKLKYSTAHLEAGLRSYNRAMPEEHNRVLTDHASDLCFAPTVNAMKNLESEGLAERSILVGDVMTDVCLQTLKEVRLEQKNSVPVGDYVLATIHRAENTDDRTRLEQIIKSLHELPIEVRLPVHPRLRARCDYYGIELEAENTKLTEPMKYRELIATADRAAAIVTDSGGLQKEAFLVRTPCVTVRSETEWIETVQMGWNKLIHEPDDIYRTIASMRPEETDAIPYGDGNAALRTIKSLIGRS